VGRGKYVHVFTRNDTKGHEPHESTTKQNPTQSIHGQRSTHQVPCVHNVGSKMNIDRRTMTIHGVEGVGDIKKDMSAGQ
jgi:hypothetical protein